MINEITVDVYASWSDSAPVYRIYMDTDLLTERIFPWPGHEAFVREKIIVDLEPGTHALVVEQINKNGSITVKNMQLNGEPSSLNFTTHE